MFYLIEGGGGSSGSLSSKYVFRDPPKENVCIFSVSQGIVEIFTEELLKPHAYLWVHMGQNIICRLISYISCWTRLPWRNVGYHLLLSDMLILYVQGGFLQGSDTVKQWIHHWRWFGGVGSCCSKSIQILIGNSSGANFVRWDYHRKTAWTVFIHHKDPPIKEWLEKVICHKWQQKYFQAFFLAVKFSVGEKIRREDVKLWKRGKMVHMAESRHVNTAVVCF